MQTYIIIKKIKVNYNNSLIPIKNFPQYVDLYIGGRDTTKRIIESSEDRWEYAVALSPRHEFLQVSFVNGNSTYQGGKHVDHIVYQITSKLKGLLETKRKLKDVKPAVIKEKTSHFSK